MKLYSLFSFFLLAQILHNHNCHAERNITSFTNSSVAIEDELIVPEEPKYLNLILEKLQDEQAEKCTYGSNPLVIDICKSIDRYNLDNYKYRDVRVEDLVHRILNRQIVDSLQKECKPGEWCLSDDHPLSKQPLGRSLLAKHSDMLCMFASCFGEIEKYINNCVSTELSKNFLNVVPALCDAHHDKDNRYCVDSAMEMYHLSVSVLQNGKNGALVNTCQNRLIDEKLCQHECKSIALQTKRLQSCCKNTSLIANFKPLNWITVYSDNEVDTYCDLPLTGFCTFDGKYYLGVTPNIVMIAVVLTALMTTIFCLVVYICCFNPITQTISKTSYVDSISYSQLNNSVEQVMDLVVTAEDSEYYKEKFDFRLVGEQTMSNFVNTDQKEDSKENLLNF